MMVKEIIKELEMASDKDALHELNSENIKKRLKNG